MKTNFALWVCGGLLLSSPVAWSQATDAAAGNHQVTDCMTQSDPASQKEDAQEICRQKLKQGIKVGKPHKKKEPKDKPPTVSADKPANADKPADAETSPPK